MTNLGQVCMSLFLFDYYNCSMVWVVSRWSRNSSLILLVLRPQFTGGWSKFQKWWNCHKEEGSNIKGGVFFSFLSIKTYVTSCSCYSCFSRYYTKREMPRIKLMTTLMFQILWRNTRRILKYFLNIDSLTFSACEYSVNILASKQIKMPYFVSIARSVLIFSRPGG